MASSLSKNIIKDSSFGNINGDVRIGDGLDEKKTEELFKENNEKQLEEIKKNISDSKGVQNQEIRNILREELQQHNIAYEFDLLNQHFGSDIDEIREDIDNSNVDRALKRLLKLKEQNWDKANSEIRFRVLTNIGVIYSKIEKYKEASEYFIEAYKVSPDNPKALNNVGIAFMYQDKLDLDIFNELQKKSLEIYTNLDIRFNRKEQTIEEIEADLPSEFLEKENILMALINHAHNKAQPDKAITYCKKAVDINNTVTNQENLANSILTKFLNYSQLTFKYSNKTDDKKQINDGIELFEKCWEYYQNGEIKKYKADIKAKQAILYTLLGEIENAESAIEVALQLNSTDEYFLKYKAQILVHRGENKDAIEILKSLDFIRHPDASISLSICYLQLDDVKNAISTLKELISLNQNHQFEINAIGLLLNIYISEKLLSDAEELIKEKSEIINTTNSLLLDKCRFLFKKGKHELAIPIFEKVISKSDNDAQQINFLIGQIYEEQENIEKAIEYYSKDVDLTQNNFLTNKIVSLYLSIKREDEALSLLSKIRENNGIIEGVTKNEIILHIHKGDLPKAKEIADLYITNYPDDAELKINLAVINARLGYHQEVELFLKQDFDCNDLNINLIELYLDLLANNGLRKKAYEILYDLWNKKNNHIYNDLLIRFNVNYPLTNEVAGYSKYIKENYAVKVKNENDHFNWYILTNKEDIELFPNEINKNSNYYTLLGRKLKDRININLDPIVEKIEVVEIQHKFGYILTKAFEKIGTDYKGKSLFKTFTVDKFNEFIETENEKQREIEESEKEFLKKYYNKQLPINFFARFYNVSPIRIWYDFTSYRKAFHCTLGLANEFEHLIKDLENDNDNKSFFIDIYTLLTIYNLPNKDVIVKSLPLKTAQQTLDIVEDFIIELRSGVDFDSMRLFIKDNVKYKIEEPVQDKHDTLDFFKALLDWIKTNISVEASDLFLKKNHESEDLFIDVFGKSTYYTILLAKENNGIAYIDDFISRDFLCGEFNVKGIWTQSVVNYLVKSGNLIDVHNDTIKLAQLNYRHTSISAHTLYESCKQAKYKIRAPFTKVAKILRGKISSDSAVVIGIIFLLYVLKDNNLSVSDRKNITIHVISELLVNRTLIKVYEQIYMLLLRELVNNPTEVDFIFDCLRKYLSYFRLDEVIEEHPAKYAYVRHLAVQMLEFKKNKKTP